MTSFLWPLKTCISFIALMSNILSKWSREEVSNQFPLRFHFARVTVALCKCLQGILLTRVTCCTCSTEKMLQYRDNHLNRVIRLYDWLWCIITATQVQPKNLRVFNLFCSRNMTIVTNLQSSKALSNSRVPEFDGLLGVLAS